MHLLIVYYQESNANIRNTIDEHLYSFARYSGEKCYYLNIAGGIPSYITKLKFDLIIYHYTFCVCRNFRNKFEKQLLKWQKLKDIAGYKVAIPQDEYLNTDLLCKFFKEYSVKTVFTCLPESEWEKVYPRKLSGVDRFVTVLTGYVDEASLERVLRYTNIEKDIDVGYRARRLPYYLGRHGCLKWQLAEKFIDACNGSPLKIDISNDPTNVYFGDDWYKFLARCRTVLGCEGGSSLLDPDGTIRSSVDTYVHRKPDASYEEVEKVCFPGKDGNLKLFAISPRHFESCITKTCQVLVEGEYAGILKPGIHYIEIKKDWSNIMEVVKKVTDHDLCRQIAQNAYRDIVESRLYTYRNFVHKVMQSCSMHNPAGAACANETKLLDKLVRREKHSNFYLIPYRLKYLIHSILRSVGLFQLYLLVREYGIRRLITQPK